MKKNDLCIDNRPTFGMSTDINFTASSTTSSSQSKTQLSNIKAMKASAGEWSCDPTNARSCKYGSVESTGVLSYTQ